LSLVRLRVGYGAVVVVLVAGAVVAMWLLTRNAPSALAELDPPAVPVTAMVTAATLDYAADAALSADFSEGPGLLATGLAGTVTASGMSVGQELGVGQAAYAVDGVPVVAYDGPEVLYRPLRLGAQGPDVVVAQRLLNALLETEVDADGTFGRSTDRAVRAYERRIGVTTPTGVLEPSWFVRLPARPFVVAQVDLQPGQPAPAAGEVIANAASIATAITLTTDSTGPAGEYEFITAGQVVPATRGEDGRWQVADETAATRVLLGAEPASTTATVSGRVRMVDGTPGQGIPGAAVITDRAGATCTVLAEDREVVRVDIVGAGADGLARVAPTLPDGAQVLLNPLVVLGDVECPGG
jgi:peptidoglycan hydrolase-like protein with peptidoglycan-binding domain